MNFGTTSPIVEAELNYRREQIAHDFAVAHGWELSVRRLARRVRRNRPPESGSRGSQQLVTPGRLGWR